jgi:putative transposase
MGRNSTDFYDFHQLGKAYKEIPGLIEERVGLDIKRHLKMLFEDFIMTEFEEKIICVPEYDRDENRKNSRNGFYMRSLHTVYGVINDLKIPRPRSGGYTPSIFKKYERRESELNNMITECYWRGISTRDMSFVMSELTGCHLSASAVTRLTKQWDDDVVLWHKRPISDEYIYLVLDGVWIKNRSLTEKRRLVHVAYGVLPNGQREIIDFMIGYSESEAHWIKFLTNLKSRGFNGKNLQLIVSDGCKGLINAVDMVFPLVDHQLCWAHKMRNILKKVKTGDQKEVNKDLGEIFDEEVKTKGQAMKVIWSWSKKWRKKYPSAVKCLEKDLDRVLNYLKCPSEHHKALRTSNHIERQFKEFRRRLRSMEVLPNRESAERALFALSKIRNEKLKSYPLKDFTHNYLR